MRLAVKLISTLEIMGVRLPAMYVTRYTRVKGSIVKRNLNRAQLAVCLLAAGLCAGSAFGVTAKGGTRQRC